MGMSSAATRYLLTIYRLSGEGAPVRSVDISRALGVSPASVVHMMGVLTAEGFITKRHYGRVQLTGEGIWAANQLHTKCMLLESFLAEELAVAEEVAHRDAVACLCSLSEESIERIVRRVLPGNAVMLRAVGESEKYKRTADTADQCPPSVFLYGQVQARWSSSTSPIL